MARRSRGLRNPDLAVETSPFVGYFLRLMFLRMLPIMLVVSALATSCGRSDRAVRHYREVNFSTSQQQDASPASDMPMSAAPGSMPSLPPGMQTPTLPLDWDTPEGWTETRGSGMRVVTFAVDGLECTILTFPGDVGGDAANINRWLGQLNASLSQDAVSAFVSNPSRVPTVGGYECKLFDFADVLPAGSPKGMLAAIIPVGENTAFVKIMGDAPAVAKQKTAFIALCKSIRMKPEQL